jgi:hypothetical protein
LESYKKLVRLEASTKPHVYNLIHEFFINMAFTMACPNFKKGLKMVFGPLGVKHDNVISFWNLATNCWYLFYEISVGDKVAYNCMYGKFYISFEISLK